MAPNVVVKESDIDGRGVFASRDFKAGETVIEWDCSRQLSPEESKALPESEKKYVVHFRGNHILMQPPARYVNHSCNANTRAEGFRDVATRDIRKGEEITADYSETMDAGDSMQCKCGYKNCRGIIRVKSGNT